MEKEVEVAGRKRVLKRIKWSQDCTVFSTKAENERIVHERKTKLTQLETNFRGRIAGFHKTSQKFKLQNY